MTATGTTGPPGASPRPAQAKRKTVRQPPAPPTGRSPWPTVVALAGVLVICGMAIGGFFTVRHVEVIGNGLPTSEIVQKADVSGKNIFRLRSDDVVTRLAQIPSVEVIHVDTSFPSTVRIFARLRQPYVAWQTGDVIQVVDASGNIIGTTNLSTSLPIIVGPPHAPPPAFAVMQAARYAATLLPPAPNGAIRRSQIDVKLGMVVVGRSGWQAVIGTGDPQTMVGRVATVAALLRTVYKQRQVLTFADVRFRTPYYRTR
jgi:hypothetical protein